MINTELYPIFSFGLQEDLAHLSLGNFPTPIEYSSKFSSELSCEFFLKRDDRSGTLYGGNKVRKLEFLLGEFQKKNRRILYTVGGFGSHHVLATSLYGKKHGFSVAVALYPQPMTEHVQNNLSLTLGSGADVRLSSSLLSFPVIAVKLFGSLSPKSRAYISPGGSSALGNLGYVNAALELAAQVEQGVMPPPDIIVLPLGSCGTVAGLALGLSMTTLPSKILAVRVVDRIVSNLGTVYCLIRSTAKFLARKGAKGFRVEDAIKRIQIEHREFGRGYGYPTKHAKEAKKRAKEEGLLLETTYTAKALAGLFRYPLQNKTVLFWNTFSSADLYRLPRKSPRKLLCQAFS